MLELYHNDMSSCAQKVRAVLEEKGLEWTGHHLNLRAGDAQRPDYLKLNPNALVPTLVHDGTPIIESTVISEYLEDAFPEAVPLRPADALGRSRMRWWTQQLDESVHTATVSLSMCIAFRHQHLEKTPEKLEAYLNAVPNPDRKQRLRSYVHEGYASPWFEPALRRYVKLLEDMHKTLGSGAWLAGSTFSLAETAYMPYMTRLTHLGLDELIDARPRVREWTDRLFQRPSYKRAI